MKLISFWRANQTKLKKARKEKSILKNWDTKNNSRGQILVIDLLLDSTEEGNNKETKPSIIFNPETEQNKKMGPIFLPLILADSRRVIHIPAKPLLLPYLSCKMVPPK